MVSEHITGLAPSDRRLLLLLKAAENVPLEQAVAIAKQAEDFVNGNTDEAPASHRNGRRSSRSALVTSEPEAPKAAEQAPAPEPIAPENPPGAALQTSDPEPAPPIKIKRTRRTTEKAFLSPEMKEKIIQRIGRGQTNAEITKDLGLPNPRQIQGIRISLGSSRRAKGPAPAPATEPVIPPAPQKISTEAVEDSIRYLRRQDDVVVRENEQFVVNGRERLSPAEIIERANRIRARRAPQPELIKANGANAD